MLSMSEDRLKISLRSGSKRKARPNISTPKQISAPMPVGAPLPRNDGRGAPPNDPAQPLARARPLNPGGKTTDLVKRRYSARFNDIPSNQYAPPVPAMPSMDRYETTTAARRPPGGGGGGSNMPLPRGPDDRGRGPSGGAPPPAAGSGPIPVDVKTLRDPKLIPDQYVATMLSDASEEEIARYEEQLRAIKKRAAADLQQSIYQNRGQFIKISKEAEKLKGEMRTLRNLMADLKMNTTALRSASSGGGTGPGQGVGAGGGGGTAGSDSASINSNGNGGGQSMAAGLGAAGFSTGLSKRDKRSSVADRTALWNSQMQALYKNVEGSQRFLPMTPGRHVVQNAGQWIELDNATYKSRRAMQIFLLNDHLLVASRKKRKTEGGSGGSGGGGGGGPMLKLVADRCWPLLDIEVVDMAGSSESVTSPGGGGGASAGGASSASSRSKLVDAIMVRGVGQETVLYRTEKADDPEKAALLLNLRKVVEELRRGIQSELDASNKAKETINYFASRDPGLLQKTDLLETLSDIKDMLIEVDGKQQNLRWVESQMDELDIDIALQQFEPAVARVEKMQGLARGLRNNAVAQDFIEFKVAERSARLAALVLRELVDTHNAPRKTRRHVAWLARLGYEDRARAAYLEARSATIQKRARQCIFQGDLHLYIWELSFVYFSIIRNTVACFQSCFPPPLMSACVQWAKREVEAFNRTLARQLSSTERGGTAWCQCMDQARAHARMLADVGIDFRNLVGLEPPASGVGAAGTGTGTGTGAPGGGGGTEAVRQASGPVGLGLS